MKLTKPDRGWSWVVLGASFGAMVVNGCLGQGIGVVHMALLENFRQDNMRTSLPGSLFAATQSCGGVVAGFILRKVSCRTATVAGSLVMAAGFVVCVFLQSLEGITFVYGGVVGAGAGLTYTTGIIVIGFNFDKKRYLASGIAVSGVGMGVLALSPVVEKMRELYGSNNFFFILAGISLHLCVFGFLYFPSELEKKSLVLDVDDNNSNEPIQSKTRLVKQSNLYDVCSNMSFMLLCFSLLLSNFGIYIMFLHLPNYAVFTGSTPLQGALLISISGICSMVSRILIGLSITNDTGIDVALLLFGTIAILGVANMMLPLYGHYYLGQVLYSVFLGLYSGSCFPLMSGLSLRLVGLHNLAMAVGVKMFFVGLGILSGPPLAGLFIDVGGTYDQCFVITGVIILFGAMFTLASEYFRTRREHIGKTEYPAVEIPDSPLLQGNGD